MSSEAYLHKIHRLAKPDWNCFTINYKNPKNPIGFKEFNVRWTSYNPLTFTIGCMYFDIKDFLHIAKTTGYWGEYNVLYEEKIESPSKWHISIEDFERIVKWLTEIHEKKYYVQHDIFL